IAAVDKLIGRIIGSDDPKAIRKVNRTITGHFLDMEMAAKKGFDTLTGGRNEAMNLFFDHDVYNPWRPAMGWPLSEDLASHWVLIPQAPVPGRIGEHCPIPQGVPEEYTQGMRQQIWQDLSIPALQRKFLHLYLEWRHSSPDTRHSPWVFGWHEHTNDLFPDDAQGRQKKLRRELVEYVEWLNANFIGRGARYANTDEVRDEFLAWEKAHPKQSSFHYPVKTRDWVKYPYQLKGLARELMYAHYAQEITAFKDKGVHVHKLLKTDGRNWTLRDGKVVCTGATKDLHLLWSDRDKVTIDLSGVVKGEVRQVAGGSGSESVPDTRRLTVSEEPIVLLPCEPAAKGETARPPSAIRHPQSAIITFAVNVHDWPHLEESAATVLRLIGIFEKNKVLGDFYFTPQIVEHYEQKRPDVIQRLKQSGMGISYHVRPPHPTYGGFDGRLRDLDDAALAKTLRDYETYRLDPTTGELQRDKAGGYTYVAKVFGRPPVVASPQCRDPRIRAAALKVYAELGAKMVVAYHESGTKLEQPFERIQGLLARPSDFSITRWAAGGGKEESFWWSMLDTPRAAEFNPAARLQSRLAAWKGSRPPFITALIHENDFSRANGPGWNAIYYDGEGPRSRPKQPPFDLNTPDRSRPRTAEARERIWKAYEELVACAAANLRVVTAEEIVKLAFAAKR
ncbi:MAG: hypothetical protein HZA91_19520, partial [Verrucomicrobia bacterium]|nr:hypothetical protein [Verrucomicrobiota bacterium]